MSKTSKIEARLFTTFGDVTEAEFRNFSKTGHEFISKWDENFAILIESEGQNYISKTALIHPTAIIGSDVILLDNVVVGPYCYIKSKVILGPGTVFGYAVEADRLITFENCKIAHSACVGRSIFGKGCNFGFNFVNATRHLKGRKIKAFTSSDSWTVSEAKHHGSVIGNDVKTAINVSTMPGTTIEPRSIIFPGAAVKRYHLCNV